MPFLRCSIECGEEKSRASSLAGATRRPSTGRWVSTLSIQREVQFLKGALKLVLSANSNTDMRPSSSWGSLKRRGFACEDRPGPVIVKVSGKKGWYREGQSPRCPQCICGDSLVTSSLNILSGAPPYRSVRRMGKDHIRIICQDF
jgi:hypothetical protein